MSAKELPDTYPTPEHGWTCFHCGETFMHQNAARLHFGASVYDEPKCQISAHRLRAMEEELRRYRAQDSDADRAMHAMVADHQVALRRAEEQGYARGLDAAKRYPETLGLRRAS